MTIPPDPSAHPEPVEGPHPEPPFRTFTVKDFFNRDRAYAQMRAEQRRPFASGDLNGAGLSFVEMPEAGGSIFPSDGGRAVRRVGEQTEDELRLARDWASRQP